MKTKNKLLAMAEIAIVLCSVFLVALPAITADQNTQEVSACTVTTSSEDDYVLGIYGNANEDDIIDMRDLTYVKLIFFGKKPETELADAKYDGEINPLDFIQIKLIIVGKEKELTFVDSYNKIVTAKKPINRIVVTWRGQLEVLRTLGVGADRIVGVETLIQSSEEHGVDYKIFFPEYQDKATVGIVWTPDVEKILSLNPDCVFLIASGRRATVDAAADTLKSAGIPVLHFFCGVWDKDVTREMKMLGYIFDNRERAEEFIEWREGIIGLIKDRVEKIPEDDKPNVYFESSSYHTVAGGNYQEIEAAGGKNIFFEMGGYGSVDPEAVVERDPDIVVKQAPHGPCGYHLSADATTEIEKVRDEIMSRLELQQVKAVKVGHVYVVSGYILSWGAASGYRGFLSRVYLAKWFHPDLFEDLDPKAIHQEYLTRFHGLDIDLDEHGVFVYPPLED